MNHPAVTKTPGRHFVLILLAVALSCANSFAGTFQFDDWNVIVHDARVQSLAAWWDSMPGIRPLLKLSYAINNASGLGVAGFHAFNVGVHAINALLVYALLLAFARRGSMADPEARGAALVATLLFVTHPVQTEAVTYLSGRSTSLAALWSLASILAWHAGRERRQAALIHVVSPLLFVLALATKEMTAVIPVALLLWAATDIRQPFRWTGTVRDTAVHWGILLAVLLVAMAAPAYRQLLSDSLQLRDPLANLLTQIHGVSFLAGQLWRLHALNADPALQVSVQFDVALLLQGLALFGLLVAGLVQLRRRPSLALGVLWFYLWLAPTNSLVPRMDIANERQLYVALIGPAWLLGLLFVRWRARHPAAASGAMVLLYCVLTVGTVVRNTVYRDEISFWQDVTEKSPHNARAFNNLGYALAAACRTGEAADAFREARRLDPADFRPVINLDLLQKGKLATESQARCTR